MPIAPSTVLNNRYRIVRLLGQGGMGAVYRAWDLHLQNAVAIKENLESTPEASQQFLREAQMLSRLHQPNLPRVTDYFTLPGQGEYLVMDFVEGEDLQTRLDSLASASPPQRLSAAPGLPETAAIAWITQVCDALEYLHSQNPPVIHRDVKPANIRVTPNGAAVLVDFGIAKTLTQGQVTGAGARAVTPGFSPPEQYLIGGTNPRSDIYALGATLYTLLCGETLPESLGRVLAAQTGQPDPARPIEQLKPGVSPLTGLAIQRAIALDPNQRFASAMELKAVLLGAAPTTVFTPAFSQAAGGISTGFAPLTPPAAKGKGQARWVLLVIILGALLIFGGLGIGAKTGLFAPDPTFTPTVTLTPTITPTITPFPKPDLPPGSPLLVENFEDNSLYWSGLGDQSVVRVENGQLYLSSNRLDASASAYCLGDCGPYGAKYYYLGQVATDKLTDQAFGIIFGLNRSSLIYYLFAISPSSTTYALLKWNGQAWEYPIDWDFTGLIERYPHTNTLAVQVDGQQLEMFINGDIVRTYTLPSGDFSGRIGFNVGAAGYELIAIQALVYGERP